MPGAERSVREQLAALLQEKGVSQRELARRLAGRGDENPVDFKRRWDSKLRWVGKVMAGGVERPTAASIEEIEIALGAPGYFRRPDREPRPVRALREETTQRRLQSLEDSAVLASDVPAMLDPLRAALQAQREAILHLASGNTAEALRVLSEAADR